MRRWNPYIDLRAEISRGVRAKCKECGVEIGKGSYRARAIPVIGKTEKLHLDCAAKRVPDIARRKLLDKDPEWPQEALDEIARHVPEETPPAPRSYMRTPILDLSYAKDPATKPCLFCGNPCPGDPGPGTGHAIRSFSLDDPEGERRFHPACIIQLAPGLCRRIGLEDSERWPAEVKAFFNAAAAKIKPTPRSPWRNTAGIPKLQRSPSARAACRYCSEKISKGELRLGREQLYGMRRSPVYFHVACFCKSDDYHPKFLELVVLKADHEITREEIAGLAGVLPPTPEEDDDVPPLLERLLTLYDLVPRERTDGAEEDSQSRLKENVVEIPKGFFTT